MDFSKIRNYLFLGLLGVASLFFIFLLRPFAYAIFWAAIIAGLSHPFYERINKRLKVTNLSTILTIMVVLVVIILPAMIIGWLLIRESIELYLKLQDNIEGIKNTVLAVFNAIKKNPLLSGFNIDEAMAAERISQLTQKAISFIYNHAISFTQNSVEFAGLFIVMLYTLFYFIRDGERMLKKIMHLCPLGDRYEILLYNKFTSTARATLKGNLIVALVQGSLGGILFSLVGIPGAFIWWVLMVLFSLIPGLGSFIIWLPAAAILLVLGHIWQGVVVILVGTLIIGTIDNFIRPILVGKDLRLHPIIIFFSTLGGIFAFSISGFIIGPIIAALFFSLWEMYEHYYHADLSRN